MASYQLDSNCAADVQMCVDGRCVPAEVTPESCVNGTTYRAGACIPICTWGKSPLLYEHSIQPRELYLGCMSVSTDTIFVQSRETRYTGNNLKATV